MPQISSEVQKRRRISFLITSKSAWQTELSTCPSWDGLPDLAKIPICFFCGGLGKGVLIQVPTERIRESWTKCLAQTNKEPQFWIKVKLLNCTTLFWVFFWGGAGGGWIGGCGTQQNEKVTESDFSSSWYNFGVTKATLFHGFPRLCWVQAGVPGCHNPPCGSLSPTPALSFLECQDTPEPQNGVLEMLWNRNWQSFPFKLPSWRRGLSRGEGAEGRRHRKGECNMSVGVTTQPLRCPQLCAHHSSGSQMEGQWARRRGQRQHWGERGEASSCRGGSWCGYARLARWSGSLERPLLVSEQGLGC